MKKINLRDYYPYYTQDMIVEVPDEVALLLREYMLLEEAYRIRTYRYKAFYSLDRDEGIEREILQKPLNPAEIWEQRQMTELIYTDRKDCKWSATTIIRILQDETYTGTLVQGKQTTPHFKLKEREDKPSSEWIRVEGTHEAIIQKHDFDLVQRLRRIDTRTSPKSDKVYLFSGILICGCCGCRMTRKTNRYKDKEYHYYYCPTGKKNGCTSSVMLKESDLIECVQDSLKGHIENVASLDALLSSISQERINRELAQEYAAQIRVNEKRVAQTEGFKAKLYENLVSGILTKEEFLSYKRKYNADIELFQKAIAEWNDKLTDVLENRSERNRWINHFMRFSTMEDIDRRAVMQLIRSIRVMGKDELHIEFNYQDEYQKAISLAEQIATKNEERMVG